MENLILVMVDLKRVYLKGVICMLKSKSIMGKITQDNIEKAFHDGKEKIMQGILTDGFRI
jgi:hypothetical protein